MKWYNKDRTQMVDLGKVDAWFYTPGVRSVATEPTITYFINGAQFESVGVEAVEIYNILTEQKEVLHS
jgi:hypothetical protein